MNVAVQVQLLGPVQIRVGATTVPLRGPRQVRLLATLALDAGQVVAIERLVDVIWSQDAPATARRQVQDLVSRLRKNLVAAGAPADVITSRDAGYLLDLPDGAVDAWAFRAAAGAGRVLVDSDPVAAATALHAALANWRGEALSGLQCDGLDATRVGLEELRLTTWERYVEVELGLGRAGDLISELAVLVEQHPTREHLVELYMHGLYRVGRTADAVAAYHRLRRYLADDLAVGPGPGLQRMYGAIVREDPALSVGEPDREPDRHAVAPHQLPADIVDFTGRAGQVLRLQDILTGMGSPGRPDHAPVAVVSGPGGIGKTALAAHVAHRVAAAFPDGQLYIQLRGTSAAPLRAEDVLDRQLRALGVAEQELPIDLDERAAMLRSLVHRKRLLFVLDDAGGAGQVCHALPAGAGCAVLITSRNQLRSLPGGHHLRLDPMPAEEMRALFALIAGRGRLESEPAAVSLIVELSAGLPLALRVTAAQLAGDADTTVAAMAARLADERRRLDEMRVEDLSVRSSFQLGYDSLRARDDGEPVAAALRRVGLPDGPHFGVAAAAALLDCSAPQAEALLARLVEASLVQLTPLGSYELHDLLRLFARERGDSDDPPRQRAQAMHRLFAWQLHSAVNAARLLTPNRLHVDPTGVVTATPGAVFEGYGDALAWLDLELANLVCSVRQAHAAGEHEVAWMLTTALWDVFTLRGAWSDWISTHEIALRSAQVLGDQRAQAWIATNLSTAYARVGRIKEAMGCLHEALEQVRQLGLPQAQASILGNLGNAYQEDGQLDTALELYRQALALHQTLGHRYGACLVLVNIADVRRLLAQYQPAAQAYQEALDLQVGDDYLAGVAQAGLGDVHRAQGRVEPAIELYRRALQAHRRAGSRPGEAATLDSLAETLEMVQRGGEAGQYRLEARLIRGELPARPA